MNKDENQKMFRVCGYFNDTDGVPCMPFILELPASKTAIDKIKAEHGVMNFENCTVDHVDSFNWKIDFMEDMLYGCKLSYDDLIKLAYEVEYISNKDDNLIKFRAEYEKAYPESLNELLNITRRFNGKHLSYNNDHNKNDLNNVDFNVLKWMKGFYNTLKPEHMENPLIKYFTQIFWRSDSCCEIGAGPYGFGVVNRSNGLGLVINAEPNMVSDNTLFPDDVENYMINVVGFNQADSSTLSLDEVISYMKNNDTSPVEHQIAAIIVDFTQPQWFSRNDCLRAFDLLLDLDMNYKDTEIKLGETEDQESGMGMNMM